jgi:hypothetical protein
MKSSFKMHLNYFTAILSLLLLSACGGGGGGSSPPATPTITGVKSIGYSGIVASTLPQNITVNGTNFSAGMTLSIRGTGLATITVGNPTINPTSISTSVVINPSPNTDRYITVDVKSATGALLASPILGVADTPQYLLSGTTKIQDILTARCAGCHTGGSPHYLNLQDGTLTNSTGMIDIGSTYCSQKKRVVAGDPRRTSSILLDRVMAAPANLSCNNNPMPPSSSTGLSPTELSALIDWVAGGAR